MGTWERPHAGGCDTEQDNDIVRETMLGLSHERTGSEVGGGDGAGPWGGLSGQGVWWWGEHAQARKMTGGPGTLGEMQAKQKAGGASEAIRSQMAGLLCTPDRRDVL